MRHLKIMKCGLVIIVLLVVQAMMVTPVSVGDTIIGFDFFPDGSPVPQISITTEYSSLGVIFSTPVDGVSPVAVPNTFWASSLPNYLSTTSSPDPEPDDESGRRQTPIIATFVSPFDSFIPATTNRISTFVSMQSGDGVLPLGSIALIGFDLFGNVVATATNTVEFVGYTPVPEILTIQAPGIASVMFDPDILNDGNITCGAIDDFTFSKVTVIPEPTTIALMTCGLLGLLGICVKRRRKVK